MTKKIKLTQGQYALVDDEDYKILSNYKWHASKRGRCYYAERGITVAPNERRKVGMHTQIMKPGENMQIDHINNNGLDNRKNNLRIVNARQQSMNTRKVKGATSQYKGVYWNKARKKWYARIKIKDKLKWLGSFDNEKKAAAAYDEAARKYFGSYAKYNLQKKGCVNP